MDRFQDAILQNQSRFAWFLACDREEQATPAKVRTLLAAVPDLIDAFSAQHPEVALHACLAIGAAYWDTLFPEQRPAHLVPFPQLSAGNRVAPSTPFDLHLHIHSERHDLNFALGHHIVSSFGNCFQVVEDIQGFRYLDSRDMIGFVDGTENPQGDHRAEVAMAENEGPLSGGSYLHIQRYAHNLETWNQLPEKEQEQVIGRTKEKDIEFLGSKKAAYAHTKRTSLKGPDGKSLEILRHSMPYGNMGEHGLYFVSYSKQPEPFIAMLESMIQGDGDGVHDRLLDYSQALTGASFFVPPISFLKEQAGPE